MDLGPRRYETFDDLYEYCIRVASAVGLVCLDIFGSREPASQAVRDRSRRGPAAHEHPARRAWRPRAGPRLHSAGGPSRPRVHAKTTCGRSPASAGGGVRSPAVKALLRHQAQRARDYYARAARALPRRDARRLVAAEIMAAIYRGVLDGIEERDYDVFSEVVRIPRPRRAVIAASTWIRTLIAPGLGAPARVVSHDADDARRRRRRRRLRGPVGRGGAGRGRPPRAGARSPAPARRPGDGASPIASPASSWTTGSTCCSAATRRRSRSFAASVPRATCAGSRRCACPTWIGPATGRCCECPALPPPLHLLGAVLRWTADVVARPPVGPADGAVAAGGAAGAREDGTR